MERRHFFSLRSFFLLNINCVLQTVGKRELLKKAFRLESIKQCMCKGNYLFVLHIYFIDVEHEDYFKGCTITSFLQYNCNDAKKGKHYLSDAE